MLDKNRNLELAYKLSRLLKIDSIREEVESHLIGYFLDDAKYEDGAFECIYKDCKDNRLRLSISFDSISIIKSKDNVLEKLYLIDDLILFHRIIDRRENGLIYTIIEKEFGESEAYNNKVALTALLERSYTFTNKTLTDLIGSDNSADLKVLFIKILTQEKKINLKKNADYSYELYTLMNPITNSRWFKKDKYPTKTFLNDENVSKIYNISGIDRVDRVHDLFKGTINAKNEKDITAIHQGLLSKDSYDLKSLKGITEQEDLLVGKSLEPVSKDYKRYLHQMFYNKFGYTGDLSLDRESMLAAITYQRSAAEISKKNIEQLLGIPYSDFDKLELEDQHRLIEEKTGKKIKPDFRVRIDGIPLDKDHIITREEVDKRIEEIASNGHRKSLTRFFIRKNK